MSLLGHQAVTTLTAEERKVSGEIAKVAAPMLRSDPQVVHFPTLAKAALSVMEHLPRIPRWRGRRAVTSDALTSVAVEVDLVEVDGAAVVAVIADVGDERAVIGLTPDEARPFFLAGLAACAAAEDPSMMDPDCDSTEDAVTLTADHQTIADRKDTP